MKAKQIIILILTITLIISCKPGKNVDYNPEKEKVLVQNTIHSCIGWAKNKDLDLLHIVIVNDSTYLEVDPEARVVKGFSDFRKAEKSWMSVDFQAVRYEIKDLQINISKSGDVAWWFCMLDDINTWKGEPASWKNTRWTGVTEKRNGKWVIVQQHFSFAHE